MTKNILKNFYLTDEYEDDEMLLITESSSKNISKNNIEGTTEPVDIELDEYETDNDEDNEHDTSDPKIEFIVEEDENQEKQISMNFEFKVSEISETIKVNLEISRKTYLEIAEELLK
jgi:hypothetical protein